MLVPLSWLRDFAPFGDDAKALAETFDDLGMVVEGIRRVGEGLDGVVVARVVEVDRIPKADKIRRVLVDIGEAEPTQVVCGAWNFEAGDVVAFATVGSVLPGDFEIGRRTMKGVESNGMICSARELELGEDHEGIIVLPADTPIGVPFAEAMGITRDVVFDLAIEGNRPDANCIAGVARDAAARLGLSFAIPEPAPLAPAGGAEASVVLEAPSLCPLFSATVLTGVTIAPSPPWLASRLTLAGMRPINNLVDISNYVMLELGQPTHPYDLDRVPGAGFRVRAATPAETLVTLDGVERRLGDGDDCLICDGDGAPLGIAGIMGGASSEISDATTTAVLEAAWFSPMAIARTSKRIGLRSEASARFERGVDYGGVARAVARFCELAAELAGATVASSTLARDDAAMPAPPRILLRAARMNAVLGTEVGSDEAADHLRAIGFTVDDGGPGVLAVVPPTYRIDCETEIDLIEEVARHHGYSTVPRTVPRSPHVGRLSVYQRERRRVRDVLVGLGLSEALGSPLIGPGDHERAGLSGQDIVADDPLVREESVLRRSLLPNLLRAVALNESHRMEGVGLFEVGHVYLTPEPGAALPNEREHLAAILAGREGPEAPRALLTLVDTLRIDGIALEAATAPGLHPTRTAAVLGAGGAVLGHLGEVDPDVLAAYGVEERAAWIEVDLGALLAQPRRSPDAQPVSRLPSSDVDLAFAVADSAAAGEVLRTIRKAGGALLVDAQLFDVYRGPGVPDGERSLAFRLRFGALDHTLTAAEVGAARQAVIDAVVAAHPAHLRG